MSRLVRLGATLLLLVIIGILYAAQPTMDELYADVLTKAPANEAGQNGFVRAEVLEVESARAIGSPDQDPTPTPGIWLVARIELTLLRSTDFMKYSLIDGDGAELTNVVESPTDSAAFKPILFVPRRMQVAFEMNPEHLAGSRVRVVSRVEGIGHGVELDLGIDENEARRLRSQARKLALEPVDEGAVETIVGPAS